MINGIKNIKIYNDFEEFYYYAIKILETNKTFKSNKDKLNFIRKNLSKDILDSYIIAGNLNEEQSELLETKVIQVKFSMDNMVKNILNHPDINLDIYNQIKDIIKYPDEIKISKKKRNCILLIKKYNKKYQVVIKTTKDRDENFITSFRYAEH